MTEQQRQEKQELIEWLEDNDRFQLLCPLDEPLRKLRRVKEVIVEIDVAIDEAAKRIRKLERTGFGVGDTATDEAIGPQMKQSLKNSAARFTGTSKLCDGKALTFDRGMIRYEKVRRVLNRRKTDGEDDDKNENEAQNEAHSGRYVE